MGVVGRIIGALQTAGSKIPGSGKLDDLLGKMRFGVAEQYVAAHVFLGLIMVYVALSWLGVL